MPEPFGCIYIIRMGPYSKIGKTLNATRRPYEIVRRINNLEPSLPYSAEEPFILQCFLKDLDEVERRLHEHFADSRMRGEWFMFSDEDRAWFFEQQEIPVWFPNCTCASPYTPYLLTLEHVLPQIPCPS